MMLACASSTVVVVTVVCVVRQSCTPIVKLASAAILVAADFREEIMLRVWNSGLKCILNFAVLTMS